MKHRDKNIVAVEELLLRECRGMSSSRTIEHLFECGLLSEARCKAFLARECGSGYELLARNNQ